MIFEDYIPTGPLAEFVDMIHFIGGAQMGTGIAFPRMHQVIIINLGTRFSSSDIYSLTAPVRETGSAVWINGKQDEPFLLGNPGVTAMYAIGVKLGMLPFFANVSAIETSNLALGAEHWTTPGIFSLQQRLLACPSVSETTANRSPALFRRLDQKCPGHHPAESHPPDYRHGRNGKHRPIPLLAP
jgi:hypothetical protein